MKSGQRFSRQSFQFSSIRWIRQVILVAIVQHLKQPCGVRLELQMSAKESSSHSSHYSLKISTSSTKDVQISMFKCQLPLNDLFN